jgi:hypothetical protein
LHSGIIHYAEEEGVRGKKEGRKEGKKQEESYAN